MKSMVYTMAKLAKAITKPIIDHFIFLLAVSIIFSSPAETRYWTPEIMIVRIAKEAKIPKIQYRNFISTSLIVPPARPVPVGKQTPEASRVKLVGGHLSLHQESIRLTNVFNRITQIDINDRVITMTQFLFSFL